MIKVITSNQIEVRMGSPYNVCDIEVEGVDIQIPKSGWQDIYTFSNEKQLLILVRWNLDENLPGFNCYFIKLPTGHKTISKRIEGIVTDIEVDSDQIILSIIYASAKRELRVNITELNSTELL